MEDRIAALEAKLDRLIDLFTPMMTLIMQQAVGEDPKSKRIYELENMMKNGINPYVSGMNFTASSTASPLWRQQQMAQMQNQYTYSNTTNP